MTDLSQLPIGTMVFVEVMSVVRETDGRFYRGIVIEHQTADQTTRVETEAAATCHAQWRSMSFRWADGLGYSHRLVRLVVPESEEQVVQLEARVRAREQAHQLAVGRQRLVAEPQGHFWWTTQ